MEEVELRDEASELLRLRVEERRLLWYLPEVEDVTLVLPSTGMSK
jgi:hypothetical protein